MDSISIKNFRQDLQDYLDFLNSRFPEETGNMQTASRNKVIVAIKHLLQDETNKS